MSAERRQEKNFTRFRDYTVCEMTSVDQGKNRNRFYRLEVSQGLFQPLLIRAWGRIGRRVRVKVEFHDSVEEALTHANRIYRQKIRRGYKEADDSLVKDSVAVHPTQIQNLTIKRRQHSEQDTWLPLF